VDISHVVEDCLNVVGIDPGECGLGVYDCGNVSGIHEAGVYVFFDDDAVYYVGEADDVARRLIEEHCSAHIGGSEGVARFLVNYLDEVCSRRSEWIELNPVDREEYIKGILKGKMRELRIYIAICSGLKDEKKNGKRIKNKLRSRLEKCIREKLKPALNPL